MCKNEGLSELGNQTRENLCEKRDFGRKYRSVWKNSQRAFGKTLLRLEENASAFEFKCTCVFGKVFLGVLRREGE